MAKRQSQDISNDFYYDLVENASDLIQVVSVEGKFIYVNNTWCKELGYTKKQALQLSFSDIVEPSEISHCKEIFEKIFSGKEVKNVETAFISKKGNVIRVNGSITVKLEDGKPVSTRGIFRNISYERKLADIHKATQRRFRAIFDSSTLGVSIADKNGVIIETNKAFLNMTGYALGDIKGRPFTEITYPNDLPENIRKQKDFIAGKISSYTIEKRYIKKDGSLIWASVTASKVLDEEGNLTSILGVIENIDERKKLEESEKRADQLRKAILDSTNLTVISLDKNGAIQAFNRTAEKLLGYTEEEMIGISNPPFHDFKEIVERTNQLNEELGTNFKPGLDTFVGKIKLTNQPDEYELTYISKKGKRIPMLLSASPIFDSEGKIDGYIGIGLDLSERKQAAFDLEQSKLFAEAIAKQSPNSIYIIDFATKKYVYANGYLGYSGEALRDAGVDVIKKVIHPDDWEYAYKHYDEFLGAEARKVLEFELRMYDNAGKLRWMFFKETIFKMNEDGTPAQILGVAVDITDRKKAEEYLEEFQEGLKTLNEIASQNVTFDEQLDEALKTASSYLDTQIGLISSIDDKKYIIKHFYQHVEVGARFKLGQEYQLRNTFSSEVVKKKDIVVVNEVSKHKVAKQKGFHDVGAKAYIGVPVWVNGKIYGTINFISFKEGHEEFTEHQQEFVRLLSRWVGSTIERKDAAHELEQSKQFAEAIATQSPNSIYIIDLDTKEQIYTNRKILGQLGYTEAEMLQMGDKLIPTIVHPDDLKLIATHYEAFYSMKDGEFFEFEVRVVSKSGELMWYFNKETIFKRKPDGTPAQILGMGVDITERKQAEEELNKLSIVADKTDSVVVISDEKSRVEWVNEAFTRITGYTFDDVKGKQPSVILKGPNTEKSSLEYMYKKQEKYEPFTVEVLNYRKDGKPIWFSITNTPVENNGELKFIEIAIDITDKKEAEFQLIKAKETAERSARIKEEFLANMSHEIRTPMNSVVGFTDILMETDLNTDQYKYVESIHTAGQNLKVILDDILSFSKMEAGKLEIVKNDFSVHELISNIIDLFAEKAREKRLDLSYTIGSSVPEFVVGDSVRINQILNNLVGNALKFTHEGCVNIGVRTLGVEDKTVRLEFVVKDTGIGIPKNKLSKVFESFTQATADTTRKYGGTGLGLTIAKRLVELQGGKIQVKSKADVGTTFSFDILFEISDQKKVKKAKSSSTQKRGEALKGYKILLCEDNELNQRLALEVVCRLYGATLHIADNGKIGLEMLEAKPYDLVLMDIHMPEMDGIEAGKKIRASGDERVKNTPIIAMTADAMEKERKRCFSIGMNDYVSKPFRKEELLEKILKHATKPDKNEVEELPLYDLSNLYDVSMGDKDFVKEMIKSFMNNTPKELAHLDDLIDKGELLLARKQAHKLKSSLGLMGMIEAGKMAEAMEHAEDADAKELTRMASELKDLCNKALKALEKEL